VVPYWLKPNKVGVVFFIISFLFIPFFYGPLVMYCYPSTWLFYLGWGISVLVAYPITMFLGMKVGKKMKISSVFIPAFSALAIVSFLDMGAYICFDYLFYFIFTSIVSIPMIILLIKRLKKFRITLFTIVIVSILGLVYAASVGIYIARPLILLAYLLFALIVSLTLLPLINAPFHKDVLITYMFFIFSVIVVHRVPWTSRHHFLHNLGRIRAGRYLDREEPGMIVLARRNGQGMTFADVEQIMQRYPLCGNRKLYRPLKELYKPQEPFKADWVSDPNARKELSIIDGIASYRHSGGGGFGADFGWVEFKDGHVVRVRFLPD